MKKLVKWKWFIIPGKVCLNFYEPMFLLAGSKDGNFLATWRALWSWMRCMGCCVYYFNILQHIWAKWRRIKYLRMADVLCIMECILLLPFKVKWCWQLIHRMFGEIWMKLQKLSKIPSQGLRGSGYILYEILDWRAVSPIRSDLTKGYLAKYFLIFWSMLFHPEKYF